ncbi:hypothetical protein B4U80_01348 [Leptotrombidium deliense]|uniref:Uncharacterized protein n=1 Tax=Leptotrombidium deliense TaxID=299467 RepID=A0A443SIP3_9ACAR|nr:hypothetical protein B4U80_01348 [Leptotrombidium deliense]
MQRLNAILLTIIAGFVCVCFIVIANRDQKRSVTIDVRHHSPHVNSKPNLLRLRNDQIRGPWPLPRLFHVYDDFYYLNRNTFRFKIVNNSRLTNCDILLNAISRYNSIIFANTSYSQTFDVKCLGVASFIDSCVP